MRNILNKSKGTTLIELLIYMAILSVMLIVTTDILVSILDLKIESEATTYVEQDGRYILSKIGYDAGRASAITTPSAIGDTTATLTLVIAGENFDYQIVSNNFQLTNNSGTFNLNSNQTAVGSASFRKIGNALGKQTVIVEFTINSIAQRPAGIETRNYRSTFGLR